MKHQLNLTQLRFWHLIYQNRQQQSIFTIFKSLQQIKWMLQQQKLDRYRVQYFLFKDKDPSNKRLLQRNLMLLTQKEIKYFQNLDFIDAYLFYIQADKVNGRIRVKSEPQPIKFLVSQVVSPDQLLKYPYFVQIQWMRKLGQITKKQFPSDFSWVFQQKKNQEKRFLRLKQKNGFRLQEIIDSPQEKIKDKNKKFSFAKNDFKFYESQTESSEQDDQSSESSSSDDDSSGSSIDSSSDDSSESQSQRRKSRKKSKEKSRKQREKQRAKKQQKRKGKYRQGKSKSKHHKQKSRKKRSKQKKRDKSYERSRSKKDKHLSKKDKDRFSKDLSKKQSKKDRKNRQKSRKSRSKQKEKDHGRGKNQQKMKMKYKEKVQTAQQHKQKPKQKIDQSIKRKASRSLSNEKEKEKKVHLNEGKSKDDNKERIDNSGKIDDKQKKSEQVDDSTLSKKKIPITQRFNSQYKQGSSQKKQDQ